MTPFFDHLIDQGVVNKKVWSIHLNKSDLTGEISFGLDDAHFGGITYVPIISDQAWEVPLQKIAIGDDELDLDDAKAVIEICEPSRASTDPPGH
jgi:saccharopepsin